ncbi:VPS8 subunit of corvet complex family, partial [Trichomonas vaginalis G3]
MNETSDFLNIITRNEFVLGSKSPLSLSVNFPICSLAYSSKEISIFDLEKLTTKNITRQSAPLDSVIICSDISPNKNLVATGHSDGEIVIWLIDDQNILITTKTNDTVMQIRFINQNTLIHSDSNGIVYTSTISTKLFKKQITTVQLYDFLQPLTCLSVYNSQIFLSTSSNIHVFKLTPAFQMIYESDSSALQFSFSKDTIACINGHSVTLMTTDCKPIKQIKFHGTPQSIAVIDDVTTLAIYNGTLELIIGSQVFKGAAPNGLSYSSGDKIIVVGNKIFICTLADVKDRVNALIKKDNWSDAFSQIISNNVLDLRKYLIMYSKSEKFDINLLFSTCIRLECLDFLLDLPFDNEKNEMIVKYLIESKKFSNIEIPRKIIEKIFNSDLIKNIKTQNSSENQNSNDKNSSDVNTDNNNEQNQNTENDNKNTKQENEKSEGGITEQSICEYIMRSPLKLNTIDTILYESITKLPRLASDLCLYYLGDLYLSLLLNTLYKNWSLIIQILKEMLINNTTQTNIKNSIEYLITEDIKEITSQYPDEMDEIFCTAISLDHRTQELCEMTMPNIRLDSTCWDLITSSILIGKIEITDNNFYLIFAFLSLQNQRLFKLRQEVLKIILKKDKVNKKHLLVCSQLGNFQEIEFEIIKKLQNPEILILSLIDHKLTSYKDLLKETVKDKINDCLLMYYRWLIRLNAQEFSELCIETQNMNFIYQIHKTLLSDKVCHWHFLKYLFLSDWACYNSNDEMIFSYLIYLSKYNPQKIVSEIPRMKSIP